MVGKLVETESVLVKDGESPFPGGQVWCKYKGNSHFLDVFIFMNPTKHTQKRQQES